MSFQKLKKPYVALVIASFGYLIQQFPLGQRAVNMELAIAAHEQSLQVMTCETMPIEWATSMMNLANAYVNVSVVIVPKHRKCDQRP